MSTYRYPVGTCLELYLKSPWEFQADVEIIARTSIKEVLAMGTDYKAIWFEGKGLDSTYNDLVVQNAGIYMVKKITRKPFAINADEQNTTSFTFFHDDMVDLNKTKYLVKRINLETTVNVGDFSEDNLNDAIKEKIKSELLAVTSNYSGKSFIESVNVETLVNDKTTVDAEDADFLARQQAVADAITAAEKAVADRLVALVARESAAKTKETELVVEENTLTASRLEEQRFSEYLDTLKKQLLAQEQQQNDRAEDLAQEQYEIQVRAQKIYERETELGLSHEAV